MAIRQDEEESGQEAAGQPFLQDESKWTHNSEERRPWMVYLSSLVAVCGSYEFGTCAGYSSPTQSAIINDLHLSLAEFSLFGSILTFGAMIGAITSGPIGDLLGRKGAMRVATGACVAGWLTIYFAQGVVALDVGRFATGYGMGVFSYVVPVFIAEIAPKNLRGALTTLNQFMICTAVSISFIIGNVLSWRTLALTALVPCVILTFGLFFIPESPRWLAKERRQKEFEMALRKLRGEDVDVSQEAAEIQDFVTTLEQLPKPKVTDLFQRMYLRSVIIGVGLMVCQQFGGINSICFYVANIFESAGFSVFVGTISYAIIQVVVTGIGGLLMDKAGRKPLLLVNFSSNLTIKENNNNTNNLLNSFIFHVFCFFEVLFLCLINLFEIQVYIGSFSIGMGPVPWVVMSEIFPINIKGLAGSMATLTNWFGAWACSYTFNFLMAWSSYGTFLIYAVVNAMAIGFVVLIVPETKGKSLEQIQAAING
ncbi:sugar transporter ERD6-like 7 [Cucumis melo var. makuwa]|uniref:Sugar transporter ERD6-like 7 n=1 Tax=Cucumis melo var. makuwa TaxID=1194695 RepID=A0A5A7UQA5_CUCMM|nr:sugar transporter ERD6-like 7 [Cucumis melo var. makuwa]